MRGFYFAKRSRHAAIQLSFSFLSFLVVSGCTPRYLYTPTPAERALATKITLDGVTKEEAEKQGISLDTKQDFPFVDADVFAYANDVKQAWRNRSQGSRITGVLTGASRVGLAGAATTVAATSPARSTSDAVPVLTGIATFIGEIFGIVDPGGRAEAYQDGLKLILEAEAEFIEHVPGGIARKDRLTSAGRLLYRNVVAAIILVDKALQGRIPSKAEIDAATTNLTTTMEELKAKIKKEKEEEEKEREANKKEKRDSKGSEGSAETPAGAKPPAK